MDRNELIERLEYVLALIQRTIQLNTERDNIRKQYTNEIPPRQYLVITPKDNPVLFYGIIIGVTALLSIRINIPVGRTGAATHMMTISPHLIVTAIIHLITRMPTISLLLGYIPLLFIGKLAVKPITKLLNKRIAKKNIDLDNKNDEIRKHNLAVQEKEQQVVNQLKQLQSTFAAEVYSWFPEDYLRLEAVEYFLKTVKNNRADTLKEAINIYVNDKQHQEQMQMLNSIASNQQDTNRLLRVNNMLSAANLVVGMQTRDAVDRNTEAVDRNTNAVHSNTEAVHSNTDAVNRLRKKIRR